ncbi:MAG: proline--tRNA ligase [Planctomycetes bacterium]|nr:proline--tRNA ligase [Planctomycetota bacterium]
MRWTQTLIPTLKETPADAEVVSHKLMLRAGLIRKLASGTYNYLPLGFRALNKVVHIVRDEMDRAGANEILMPALQPVELWKETGRYEAFGPIMCQFQDRTGRMNVLGPTHEEVVTDIVRNEINSYRQLPITLYQIQVKFRDEIRPRFGVLRSREFIMKDAYSFDVDTAGMDKSYEKMYEAYGRIFTRCGLVFRVVQADSGLMGGSASCEFMVPSPAGEDLIVSCECGYGANIEIAEGPVAGVADSRVGSIPPPEPVSTPGSHTVEQVCRAMDGRPADLVKTLICTSGGKPFAALVRGDHELSIPKLIRSLKSADVALADAATIQRVTGGPLGFSGPVGLTIPIYADRAVAAMSEAIVGGNRADTHLRHAVWNRDYKAAEVWDLRMAVDGDPCPKCGRRTAVTHGIEVGHVFKLGTKYSDALKAHILTEAGKGIPAVMGCYGIGVNRIVAACLENASDDRGIQWPWAIAPYHVLVTSVDLKKPKVAEASQRIYEALSAARDPETGEAFEVLWDDRDSQAGVKFKDADLIGIPLRVTVGKAVEQGNVEVKSRKKEGFTTVPVDPVSKVVEAVQTAARGPIIFSAAPAP